MPRSAGLALYLASRSLPARAKSGPAGQTEPAERPSGSVVWCHAGAGSDADALVEVARRIGERRPKTSVVVTGRDEAALPLAPPLHAAGDPEDTSREIRRFLDHWRPDAVVLAGDVVRPAAMLEVQARGVPLLLVDARLPDSFARDAVPSGGATRVLLRPPVPGGEFALVFDGCNGNYVVTVFPSRVNFTAPGGTCGGLAFPRGMSYQEHPAVLPVVQVVRNSTTATGPAGFKLRSQATLPLALDADVAVAAPLRGTGVNVHTFTGESGQVLSWGVETAAGVFVRPTVVMYDALPSSVSSAAPFSLSITSSGKRLTPALKDRSGNGAS